MAHKTNKLYNFIVNSYGISKDVVTEMIEKRVENLFEKHIHDYLISNNLKKMVLNQIATIVKDGFQERGRFHWEWNREPFQDYVKEVIHQEIRKKLNDEFKIEVKAVPTDASIVYRSKK